MEKYKELIEKSLYEEVYLLLEEEINKKTSILEKNIYFRDFFVEIFSLDEYDKLYNKGVLHKMAIATAQAFEKDFLKEQIVKLDNYVDVNALELMYALLVQQQFFKEATFFKRYINKDITNYPNTITQIIDNKNEKALAYLLENMENIHYNNDELLSLVTKMSHGFIDLMINQYDFDINKISKRNDYLEFNILHKAIITDNVDLFRNLIQKYNNIIDWDKKTHIKLYKKELNLLGLINEKKNVEYYEILLDDLTLSKKQVKDISDVILKDKSFIKEAIKTKVYIKLFTHPSFNPKEIDLDNSHIIYGLLANIGMSYKSKEDSQNYYELLKTYLDYHEIEDEIQNVQEFNIIGAAINVVEKLEKHFKETSNDISGAEVAFNAAKLIVKNFTQYVNTPNPNGKLSISMTDKDSNAYRLLINNGAVTPESTGFFRAFRKIMPFAKKEESVITPIRMSDKKENKDESFKLYRDEIRKNFNIINKTLSNPRCDSTITLKCQNMFLKTDQLLKLMERHNVKYAVEEIQFLTNNFSNYLKDSLNNYINLIEIVNIHDLKEKRDDKVINAKNECLKQIELLDNQVDLVNKNIISDLENNANYQQNIQRRFLKDKFSENEVVTKNIEDVITQNNQDIEQPNTPKKFKM